MFHAHIISFVTCFICILLYLFMFSWTNLLTRCLVPVSCFLLFFVSEILHRKYSRNCTGRKTPDLILSSRTWTPKERWRGATRLPHNLAAWPHLPAREQVVWGPRRAPGVRPPPIYTPSLENPKYPIIIPRKVPSPLSSSTLDWEGSGSLPGTLPERRLSPEGSTSPCLPPV